ncbi:MAG: MAPEG family protein [Rhizobiaceae bacterium]|nr:MAPEG family protein [Rhizobiaceae bacterium]
MTIAFWCVLVALLMPYVWFGAIKPTTDNERNLDQPRDFVDRLEGRSKRAWGAHVNSFEANTPFAAGVIIAHLAHATQSWIDALAVLFVILRIIYGVLYINGAGKLRSAVWSLSMLCIIGLFLIGI